MSTKKHEDPVAPESPESKQSTGDDQPLQTQSKAYFLTKDPNAVAPEPIARTVEPVEIGSEEQPPHAPPAETPENPNAGDPPKTTDNLSDDEPVKTDEPTKAESFMLDSGAQSPLSDEEDLAEDELDETTVGIEEEEDLPSVGAWQEGWDHEDPKKARHGFKWRDNGDGTITLRPTSFVGADITASTIEEAIKRLP